MAARIMSQRDPMATDPSTGERHRLADTIAANTTNIAGYLAGAERLQRQTRRIGLVQLTTFVLGLSVLLAARILPAALSWLGLRC